MIGKKVTTLIGVVMNDDEDNENYCWETKLKQKNCENFDDYIADMTTVMFCLLTLLMTRVWMMKFSAWFPILHTLTTVITRGTSRFNRGATTLTRGAASLTRGVPTRTRNTSGKMDLIPVLFSQTYENSAVAAQSFRNCRACFSRFRRLLLGVKILY